MTASKRDIGSDLAKVDAYQNTAADYDELPEVTSEEMSRAVPYLNGIPVRSSGERSQGQITLFLDQDLIDHFRKQGAGWQIAINDALRKALDA